MSKYLFELNPKIKKYSKRYIWGTDIIAFMTLAKFTDYRIPIDGFISNNEEEIGMVLLNKPVISLDMLKNEGDTLIIPGRKEDFCDFGGKGLKHNISAMQDTVIYPGVDILTYMFDCSESFTAEHVVIYGAGYIGELLLPRLSENGVVVDFFLDKDKDGQELSGIPIYHPQKLAEMDDDVVIIEAGKYWQEMDEAVRQANPAIQTFYLDKFPRFTEYSLNIRVTEHKTLDIKNAWFLAESFPECFDDRKIILLGDDLELAKGYKEVLECLGWKKVFMMVSDEDISDEDVPLLDEILYEENYLLMLYSTYTNDGWQKVSEKIEELGIADADWTSIELPQHLGHREFVLDLNLGNSFKMNYIPGLYLHGEEKDTNVKIVTLGGSTTDEGVYLIPSWPKIMFEKYCSGNIALYNSGVDGYASSQELIKLIRDILYLEPDIIVVFDGLNDIYCDESLYVWGWEQGYLHDLFKCAMEVYDFGTINSKISKDIFMGARQNGFMRKWLNNIESMYAITKYRNIKFHSFMQPMMGSQKIHTKHGLSVKKMDKEFRGQKRIELMQSFRESGKEIEKTHSYIHNLSHIFDEKDVYFDNAHVWESGNEIIADAIWQIIEPDVREIMEMKANKLS